MDMTKHKGHLPIQAPGIPPIAATRIYDLLDGKADNCHEWTGSRGSKDPRATVYFACSMPSAHANSRSWSSGGTGHLAIGLHRLPRLHQRLRIGDRDPILEQIPGATNRIRSRTVI